MGVCGKPLPAVIWPSMVHRFNSLPRQPINNDPPPSPTPEVYWIWAVNKLRWSKVESPRSAPRLSQFCAITGVCGLELAVAVALPVVAPPVAPPAVPDPAEGVDVVATGP